MKRYSNVFFIIIILILALFMIINPQETVIAASKGLNLWINIVFPALFPFFIVAELLVSLRFIDFLGIVLEPVMRPIFRLPGCSSLVVVMGFTSGFPVGALLTQKLYDEKMLTANEAERLVCFTNNSSPLFILGAVGVGMFNCPALGYLLAIAHYSSNLLLGLIFRFKAEKYHGFINPVHSLKSWRNLTNSTSDGIGKLLGDAIKNSITNILAIAGFIIVFSVLTRMLTVWGIMDLMAIFIMRIFSFFSLSYSMAYGICIGIFEMTLGARTIILSSQEQILSKLIAVSSILAFSGFSVIAQVMSIVSGIPVRLSFYLQARFTQIVLSIIIVIIGYKYFINLNTTVFDNMAIPLYKVAYSFDAWTWSIYSLLTGMVILFLLVLVSLIRKH